MKLILTFILLTAYSLVLAQNPKEQESSEAVSASKRMLQKKREKMQGIPVIKQERPLSQQEQINEINIRPSSQENDSSNKDRDEE